MNNISRMSLKDFFYLMCIGQWMLSSDRNMIDWDTKCRNFVIVVALIISVNKN